ncbi:hypothetical protein [Robinsoniella peoriensis]
MYAPLCGIFPPNSGYIVCLSPSFVRNLPQTGTHS